MTEAIAIQVNGQVASGRALSNSPSYNYEAISNAVTVWAKSTTNTDTPRHLDLLRDKSKQVMYFFETTGLHSAEVSPIEV